MESSTVDASKTSGGAIAINELNSTARAFIPTSTTTSFRGDITVEALNLAVLRAQTSTEMNATGNSAGAMAGVMAYNSVGYDSSNLFFQTVDAIAGSGYLIGQNPAGAQAYIENSTVLAQNGDVTVLAETRDLLFTLDSTVTANELNDAAIEQDDDADKADDLDIIVQLAALFDAAGSVMRRLTAAVLLMKSLSSIDPD